MAKLNKQRVFDLLDLELNTELLKLKVTGHRKGDFTVQVCTGAGVQTSQELDSMVVDALEEQGYEFLMSEHADDEATLLVRGEIGLIDEVTWEPVTVDEPEVVEAAETPDPVIDEIAEFGDAEVDEPEAKEPKAKKEPKEPRKRRYSADQIREMRALRETGMSYAKIAEQFICSGVFVRNVVVRNVYRDVI